MKTIASEIDESVNFVIPYGKGMIEARYVRRAPDYFICYLSSQSGCVHACRFCHLTTTKQVSFDQVDVEGFKLQRDEVLNHYFKSPRAKIINYNWMSRGEAISNKTILYSWKELSEMLIDPLHKQMLYPRFNISTIMPKTLGRRTLPSIFMEGPYPTIYYSLYSMDQAWRDKWLPGAMPAEQALDELKRYQDITQKIVYIHGAFIKGENDNLVDVCNMLGAIEDRGLIVKWNIVRYNPFSPVEGEESDRLLEIYELIKQDLGAQNVQIVSRVGQDCQASCGMFYDGEIYE